MRFGPALVRVYGVAKKARKAVPVSKGRFTLNVRQKTVTLELSEGELDRIVGWTFGDDSLDFLVEARDFMQHFYHPQNTNEEQLP